jgi:hypothetical protein
MRSSPPRRHCHSTLSLAATDSHSLAIYMLILLSLLSYSVKMTVSPMARGDTVRLYDANGFFGAALPEKIGVSSSRAFKHPSSQAPKHSSSLKMIPISPNASCLTTPPSVLPTTPRSWGHRPRSASRRAVGGSRPSDRTQAQSGGGSESIGFAC